MYPFKTADDVKMCRTALAAFASALILLCTEVRGLGEVVYAVNCGGEAHTDIYGIKYQKDPNKVRNDWPFDKFMPMTRPLSGWDRVRLRQAVDHRSRRPAGPDPLPDGAIPHGHLRL